VLSIGLASADWWLEHPEAGWISGGRDVQRRGMPAGWAAADAVGALYGGAWGAFASWASGEFSWSSVGWGALGGAIESSTGLVGKIVRKLQKL